MPAARSAAAFSACPHDCPSTCALEVSLTEDNRVGRIRGARDNSYTDGVICAKVARYAERLYHPDRLMKPLRRTGAKGSGQFEEISWDAALDLVAEKFLAAEAKYGPETIWLNYYAGTMGLVQRDSIDRLRRAKGYSEQFGSFCTNMAWTGYVAGTGKLAGPDPREMAEADQVVIWGTNAVATQVNVMTHAMKARKNNGARIIVVDVYRNETMKQADVGLVVRPGTDGALACAVMHVLFRDGLADRAYLEKYTDCPAELEEHLKTRTPEWASEITGLSVSEIESFAHMLGAVKKTFFRLGYGFTRGRNGAVAMHAVASIGAVTGCWQYRGGGVFHNNGAIYKLNGAMTQAPDLKRPGTRYLDQSLIGRILAGDSKALSGGAPVTGLLIQNTNPLSVAPEQDLVRQGLAREDLFTCVHEQFMTETAKMADVVLPATQFLEHDDIYKGGGHQHIVLGPKVVEPPEGPKENLFVLNALALRLGARDHPGFHMSAREHIDWMLQHSGYGTYEELKEKHWLDLQPSFEDAHFLNGFGHDDGKYHFRPDWGRSAAPNKPEGEAMGPWQEMPELPDHWDAIERADAEHPFRLVTPPARSFLNSSFNQTPSSVAREGRPELLIRQDDAEAQGVADGDLVRIGNRRGSVVLHVRFYDDVQKGTVISEGIWPNAAFAEGRGINTLTGADPVAPYGGAAFHDTAVWLRPA